jgi:hypothetical protein
MREDGVPNAGFLAPVQLGYDRSVANQGAILPAHQRPSNARTIADVKVYIA